ncbi:nitroreductase family protein [Nitrosomonas sp. Is37]|uniref:nitroreductase family protein n=1 Tax=Nitrosomonas sp. Is37 TaxID=3080535 RepID=UPI00294B84FF|nr:nitroreductase family protein [Nitrosomonas sp. Is37]MDV6345508.1 nitroreductase family protein [Nitrosomonas sp. Is37]
MQETHVEMTVFEAILARRCVRSYTEQVVSLDAIHILLEAAIHAPTALHEELWAFAIIRDKQLLKDISDYAKPLFVRELQRTGHTPGPFTEPDFNIFYEASTLILICSKKTGPFVVADCWLAAENLMLAACAMKLGSCVIGAALTALNTPDIKVKLNIPEEFSIIVPIILGHPNGKTPPSQRRKPLILTLTS